MLNNISTGEAKIQIKTDKRYEKKGKQRRDKKWIVKIRKKVIFKYYNCERESIAGHVNTSTVSQPKAIRGLSWLISGILQKRGERNLRF